jgi:predicted GNAT family acetyltransferase
MWALKQQGMESATLGVAGTNPAAIHIYESVGFRVHSVTQWYSLTVSR